MKIFSSDTKPIEKHQFESLGNRGEKGGGKGGKGEEEKKKKKRDRTLDPMADLITPLNFRNGTIWKYHDDNIEVGCRYGIFNFLKIK